MRYFNLVVMVLGLVLGSHVQAADVSLRDKIGQMLIVGFDGTEVSKDSSIAQSIQNEHIGGVVLFDQDFHDRTKRKNISNPAQVKKLNSTLQTFNTQANKTHHREQLPLLISVDYEGGIVTRLKEEYGFPATLSAATVGKLPLDTAQINANTMADTMHEAGFNLDFAPVLDVNTNPENPIIAKKERSFSSDPALVAHYAAVYSQTFLAHGIQCAYKHFPGHGSSTGDSHLGFVDVSDTWQASELYPFQELTNSSSSCGIVMTAHVVNRQLDETGLPATLSHKILTDVLRKQLSFDGVIITDDMQMKAISDHYGLDKALTLTINAGADMIIFGNQVSDKPQDTKELINIIESKVKVGEISPDRIDEAYRHIVKLKKTIKQV